MSKLSDYTSFVKNFPQYSSLYWWKLSGTGQPAANVTYTESWQAQLKDSDGSANTQDGSIWVDIGFGKLGDKEGVHLFMKKNEDRQDIVLFGAKLKSDKGFPQIYGNITSAVYLYDGQTPFNSTFVPAKFTTDDFISDIIQDKLKVTSSGISPSTSANAKQPHRAAKATMITNSAGSKKESPATSSRTTGTTSKKLPTSATADRVTGLGGTSRTTGGARPTPAPTSSQATPAGRLKQPLKPQTTAPASSARARLDDFRGAYGLGADTTQLNPLTGVGTGVHLT